MPSAAAAAAGEPWELAPCHNHSFGCSFLLHQAGEVLAVQAEQPVGFTPELPPHTSKGTAVSLSSQRQTNTEHKETTFPAARSLTGGRKETREAANHQLIPVQEL